MPRVISRATPTANKSHNCDACVWLDAAGYNGMGFSFAEMRSVAKAKANKWKIIKGEMYTKQSGVYEGEMYTFKAITAIHDICIAHDLYEY